MRSIMVPYIDTEPLLANGTSRLLEDTIAAVLIYKRMPDHTRCSEAERVIIQYPNVAWQYALNNVGGRWPEAESTIASSPTAAFHYALYVIKGPWPEGESVIATKPGYSFVYAKNLLHSRFVAGESSIATQGGSLKKFYLKEFPDAKEDWIMYGWLDWLDS